MIGTAQNKSTRGHYTAKTHKADTIPIYLFYWLIGKYEQEYKWTILLYSWCVPQKTPYQGVNYSIILLVCSTENPVPRSELFYNTLGVFHIKPRTKVMPGCLVLRYYTIITLLYLLWHTRYLELYYACFCVQYTCDSVTQKMLQWIIHKTVFYVVASS